MSSYSCALKQIVITFLRFVVINKFLKNWLNVLLYSPFYHRRLTIFQCIPWILFFISRFYSKMHSITKTKYYSCIHIIKTIPYLCKIALHFYVLHMFISSRNESWPQIFIIHTSYYFTADVRSLFTMTWCKILGHEHIGTSITAVAKSQPYIIWVKVLL